MRLLEAVASAGLAAALPARFRLSFHGLLVALVCRRGTALHGAIHRAIAFAAVVAISIAVAISMAEAALVAPEGPVVAAALKAALMARRLMMLR